MELTSKRRAYLRKKAHDLDALVRIGKEGVTDNLIQSILDAIESRELIKVKILQNCEEEKMEIMEQLSSLPRLSAIARQRTGCGTLVVIATVGDEYVFVHPPVVEDGAAYRHHGDVGRAVQPVDAQFRP